MATESCSSLEHQTTPSRARSLLNHTLVANLATTFTTTPLRPTPNSARKRRHPPNLSRSTASPGHAAHMSNIFRDASVALQGLRSPPSRPLSNSKRPRIPLSLASSTRFGHAASIAIEDQDDIEGTLPINNGVETPPRNIICTPEAVTNPAFEHWRLPQSSSPSSESGSLLPSPILEPGSGPLHDASIDSWLSGVLVSSWEDTPKPREQEVLFPNSSQDSSNKENTSPTKSSPSHIRPPVYHANHSVRYPIMKPPSPAGAFPFEHPFTPQGHLSMPPKRKKARVNEKPWGNLPTPCVPGQDFTIHDDELAGALAKLSPQVERHRKGRGAKRERCKGYFDEDVVDLKGRKLLGESAQSSELTKVQPFLGEAADAAFGFRA